MTSSIAKDKNEQLKIQRIMKIVRKTYIKPEFHDVRIGEEALCGDINIGINTLHRKIIWGPWVLGPTTVLTTRWKRLTMITI